MLRSLFDTIRSQTTLMNFLFRPINNASLTFFRVVFGVLAFAESMALWTYYHLYEDYFNPHKFQFKYYGFQWVEGLPEPFMSIFFILLITATVFIIIGRHYQIATTFFAFGFAYTFFLEKGLYLNHGYLFMWLSFTMIFLPTDRNFSWDALKRPNYRQLTTPAWCLYILLFFMSVVYFYGGIAKLNADWLTANPLKMWVGTKRNMPILGWIWGQELTAWIMAWGGMLLDLTVVFFLLFKRTRIWAYFAVIFFHLVNTIVFQIGIFPWLSLGLTALFFEPDFPYKVINYLKKRFKFIEKIENWWLQKSSSTKPAENYDWSGTWRTNRKLVLAFLVPIMLFHTTYPFRHHLLKGDVAWTEEGHRYSWRMMLRSKQGYGTFRMIDPDTRYEEWVKPRDYLNEKQHRKLYTHPDMILQFAHFLRDEWTAKKGKDFEVYAKIRCRLNGRKYYDYIDKEVDLAKVEWSFFKESDWIILMPPDQPDD